MKESPLTIPSILPVHPMREQVVFPRMLFPLFVQARDMKALDRAMASERLLVLAPCPHGGEGVFDELSPVATVVRINQLSRFPEGGCKAVVEGLHRVQMTRCIQNDTCLLAHIQMLPERKAVGPVAESLIQGVGILLKIAMASGRPLPESAVKIVEEADDAGHLADLIAVYLGLPLAEQDRVLAILDPLERLKDVYLRLTDEVQKLQVRGEIQTEVARRLGKTQKEYLLREQMRQIQEELGDEDPRQSEIADFRRRLQEEEMPAEAKNIAEKEINRLERMGAASPEYNICRTYVEYLFSVPWSMATDDTLDIVRAEEVLDEDHYDLKEIKERVLEFLAVRSLRETSKGPILCFVGPPGVGKTSLGRSIARAMGRRFIRMSLGGMKDEAEIRGHRRTYIGAMPGRIIQEICRCGANNPVFMLDEVDKIGHDFRGDPSSALLEVLDPEQNGSFCDHYLDVPFDLSRVLFITTANQMDTVPPALRDRLEIIGLSGYSDEEKIQIAVRYLIPKQLDENGLANHPLEFAESSLRLIIRNYTREAGVRGFERALASICRKVAREVSQKKPIPQAISPALVENMLGPRRYFSDVAAEEDRVGVVTGLAWTEAGGDIIFIEATCMEGQKELILTGSLGVVMQESAKTALSYVKAHAADFDLEPQAFDAKDIHIHVPGGAIAKDGPSAGVALATALISLLGGRPARREVAMTGELTLSGRILPIGGVREKVLAARRAGVRTVLLPEANRAHLRDLDDDLGQDVRVIFVRTLQDVIRQTLLPAARSPGLLYRPSTSAPSISAP